MNTALATRPTEALIKPASPEEEVLALISTMRGNNLTADQLKHAGDKVERQRNEVIVSFRKIACTRFGLRDQQVLDLSDQKIETLFSIVANKNNIFYLRWPLISFNNIPRLMKKIRLAGGLPITVSDIVQHIENQGMYNDCSGFWERPYAEKQTMVQRRKP